MTVVRYKNRVNGELAFNNLLSDLFPQMPSIYKDEVKHTVPVNIRETDKCYFLDVVAPGWTKEDFKIALDNKILTVSVDKKEENKEIKFVRNEFTFQSFKRSFTVDAKIEEDEITALYINGVLTVTLPKKENVKPAIKQITIQ